MKPITAAVLTAYEQPLEIRQYPALTAAGPGECVVRIEMAGICGTDVHLWLGQLPIPLPVIMGHETVGRIEILGEGLQKDFRGQPLAVGDRIVWASSVTCGECYYCRVVRQPTRCVNRKAYGISYCCEVEPHLRGGYAEQIHLRAGTAIFKLPDSIPTAAVVGSGCALMTAIHGLERCPVSWGDSVVVQGTGPVGLAAIAVARQSGAGKIIAIGGPAHRLAMAQNFGADVVIDIAEITTPEARRELVLSHTGGFGADLVIECVGYPAAVNEGIELPRDGGKYLVLGQYANAGNISFNPHIITRKQLTIHGSWAFEARHVDKALRLLEIPHWQHLFAEEITARYRIEEANTALDTVKNWRAGKTVLVP